MKSAGDYVSGHVSVGLPVICHAIVSMPLIQVVHERFPHILLQISENLSGLLGELILNNRLDLAMLYAAHGSEGLIRKPLLIERLCLVNVAALAPSLDVDNTVSVRQMADLPLVRQAIPTDCARWWTQPFRDTASSLASSPRSISLPSLRAAAECGFAATILPRSATSADTGSLLVTDIVEPTIERTIVLCRPSAPAISEPVQAIENMMIDTIEILVASGKWQGVTRI